MTDRVHQWAVVSVVFIAATVGTSVALNPQPQELQLQQQQPRQAKAEEPTDCAALRSAIQQREAELAYVRNAMAADRTLAVEAKLVAGLKTQEMALTSALAYYQKNCTLR